jgi:hypothetical protein
MFRDGAKSLTVGQFAISRSALKSIAAAWRIGLALIDVLWRSRVSNQKE